MKNGKRLWKRLFMRRMSRLRLSSWRRRWEKRSWWCRLRSTSWWGVMARRSAGSRFGRWRADTSCIQSRSSICGAQIYQEFAAAAAVDDAGVGDACGDRLQAAGDFAGDFGNSRGEYFGKI